MTLRRNQAGASGILIVVVLVMMLIGVIATSLLSRIGTSGRDDGTSRTRLAVAADALEQYAASASRLPCPADPTLDTGEEVPTAVGAATCTFPEGTVPWKTIGMRRDDAFDAWGRKVSYRVYTGNPLGVGSLVRPGGVSMVDCDKTDPSPQGVDGAGLCRTDHSTLATEFLAGKGFSLTDLGTARNDVAYVLLSHGATGQGGYTVSGARLDMPSSAFERNNTNSTGAFTIAAFSDPDVPATNGMHFDDLLVYRGLGEMVKRIGLSEREWPDEGTTGVTFDQATVSAAVGQSVTAGQSVGQTSITLAGAQVSAIGSGGTATNVTFDVTGGVGGIGAGSAGNTMVQSSANELLRITLTNRATNFAVTLGDFGTIGALKEQVEFKFYLVGVQVGSAITKPGCNPDGGLASFLIPVGSLFDQVDITPLPSSDGVGGTGITAFLLSELNACAASLGTCETTLSRPPNAPNTCP